MEQVSLSLDSHTQRVTPHNIDNHPEPSGVEPEQKDLIGKDLLVSYSRKSVRNLGDVVPTAYAWMGTEGWKTLDVASTRFLALYVWLNESMGKFASIKDNTIVAFRTYQETGQIQFIIQMYSATNCYRIAGHISTYSNDSYMGATLQSRTPRPGEDWTRGNDLYDGNFSYNTWQGIMTDILSCELANINQKNVTWSLKPEDGPNEKTAGQTGCLIRHVDHVYTGETRVFKG